MQKEILQRAKILLLDNEIENCGGLSRLLSDNGYRDLDHAAPSSAAARLDSQFQPDLIILDLAMPDDKGWQTLEQLRNSARKETYLPILVVTGPASINVRPEALAKGATAFLTKPYDSAEAVLLVRSLLETRFLHLKLSREVGELKTRIKQLTEINSGLKTQVAKRESDAAELRQDPALLPEMLHNSPSLIFFKEAQEGRYLDINPSFEQLFGLKRDQIIGRTDGEIFPAEQAAMFRANDLRVIESATPMEFEEVAQYADGPHLSIVSKFPLRDADGKISVICGIVTDITERSRMVAALRQSQEALHKANDELETRVRERTESARQAKEEAERANAAKSEFLSRMSHELRTPLHSILGFGQLLKMDTLSSEQEDNADRVLAAGHHLLKLVDEVLHISRIEAGNLAPAIEPVLLSDAVREAINLVQSMAVVRNVRINELACDRYILADEQRLKQVLLNLLSNAVKYNRAGGSVTLSVVETACGTLRLMISDNGPGIAPDDAAKLFIPFERLGAADSKIEGIGLGLAISKRLIELMGGEIGFESVPDNGSTFWIELPLAEAENSSGYGVPAAR
jgi:PAS domain S-box-containing protein